MYLESILSFEVLNNSVENYLKAILILTVITLLGRTVQRLVIGSLRKLAQRTKNGVDDFIITLLSTIKWEWSVIGIFAATTYLNFAKAFDRGMLWIFALVILHRIIRIVNAIVDYITAKVYLEQESVETGSKGAIKHIVLILKIIVAGVMIVIALDNLGFKISALIAGLGVTGIIIGLAVQNIVGDLFSSFCIIFDKPFETGDFIIVGDFMGVVENIGIKSTRLTSLGGEQLVFSNSDLTGSRIRNYKRMAQRRIVFNFGVEYSTHEDKLKKIPEAVKTIIKSVEETNVDRVHFQKFGASSLDFEAVYYVLSPDYGKYMNIQQQINLAIVSHFRTEGIQFAFPTQTLHVQNYAVVPQSERMAVT